MVGVGLPPSGGLEGTELCISIFPFLCVGSWGRMELGNSLP